MAKLTLVESLPPFQALDPHEHAPEPPDNGSGAGVASFGFDIGQSKSSARRATCDAVSEPASPQEQGGTSRPT
jgi:hypothetical protein